MSWLSKTIRRNKNTIAKAVGVVASITGIGAVVGGGASAATKAVLDAGFKEKKSVPSTQADNMKVVQPTPAPVPITSTNNLNMILIIVVAFIGLIILKVKRFF